MRRSYATRSGSCDSIDRPDGQQRPALVHDLSESGALLLVRTTKISVDDQITLHLHISDDAKRSRIAQGRVVRVEEVGPGDSGPWLRRVGVRFDRPLEMHETEIEAFRKRAERLGLS